MAEAARDIEDLGDCPCPHCAALCHMVPGRMNAEDALRLEEHLDTRAVATATISVVAALPNTHTMRRVLRPRIASEDRDIRVATVVYKCGPCVFLDEERGCTLTAATGRPVECRTAYGCREEDHGDAVAATKVAELIESWGTPRAKELLERVDAITSQSPMKPLRDEWDFAVREHNTIFTPYGLLAFTLQSIYEQSTMHKMRWHFAKKWAHADEHRPVVDTGAFRGPDTIPVQQFAYVKQALRDAVGLFRACKRDTDSDVTEAGRKLMREEILRLIFDIDTLTAELGGETGVGEGAVVYMVRTWIETLSRPS